MRYGTVRLENGYERPAVIEDTTVRLIDPRVADLRTFIGLSEPERAAALTPQHVPRGDVQLVVPLRPHKNIFCVGRNYLAHAEESTRAHGVSLNLPDKPTFFTKAPTALVGPDEPMRLSAAASEKYDWEAELAVVIGQRCKDVSEADALSVIFGYTCLNDVSARDLQQAHVQWFKGKSLDGTCPLGPWIVTADEIADPQQLAIRLRINGVTKQDSSTSYMIFSVTRIIAELSRGMTLEPGDVIATGTPEGVGFARTPPEFLGNGDIVEVDIESIGVLRNATAFT